MDLTNNKNDNDRIINNNDNNNTTTSIIPGTNTNSNSQHNKIKSKTVLNLRIALSKDSSTNNNTNNNNNNTTTTNRNNNNNSLYNKEKILCDNINEFVDSIKEGGYLKIDQVTLIVDDIREEIQKEITSLESLIVFLSKEIDCHTDIILTSRSSDNVTDALKVCVLCKARGNSTIPSINSNNTMITCTICKEKGMKSNNNNNNVDDINTNNITTSNKSRVRNKFQNVLDEKYFLDDDVY